MIKKTISVQLPIFEEIICKNWSGSTTQNSVNRKKK